MEAVLWILNTGAQWHMLPQSYPNYKTVHRRFQTWCCNEILRRVLTDVANELRDNVRQQNHSSFIADRQQPGILRMGWTGRAPALSGRASKHEEHAAMLQKTNAVAVRTIGIDTGKNTFHLIGLDQQGTIVRLWLELRVREARTDHGHDVPRQRANAPCDHRQECLDSSVLIDHHRGGINGASPSDRCVGLAHKAHRAGRDLQPRQGLGRSRNDRRLRPLVFRLPRCRWRIFRLVAVEGMERAGGCVPHRHGDPWSAGFRQPSRC